ncbi:hypothetical protein A8B98_16560 [Hymenobacter sp. UV11]|nr:hypothetical protein A8B98_16560 [Hymenobacter sp. UV11]
MPGRPLSESADTSAHELLLSAGRLVHAEQAGWQPGRGTGTSPSAAPPETLPAVGALGQQLLETMLQGHFDYYLDDYYAQLAARGLRVPHRLLPAVLAHATRTTYREPAEYLLEVLGERGPWLARLQPAWRPLVAVHDEASWTHGPPAQRRRFLQTLRRKNPGQARALLAATLPQVSPGLQAELLQDLQGPVEPADEPWLTPCLASPDPRVRQRAANLLVRLPGSTLVERVWAWTQPFLLLSTLPSGDQELRVTLPPHWNPDWAEVGLVYESYAPGREPARWLRQLLALIPPQRWSTHWQLPPTALLALTLTTANGPVVVEGWAEATYQHQQQEWATAIIESKLTQPAAAEWSIMPLFCLTPPQAAALILPHVPAGARLSKKEAPWQQTLLYIRQPWPRAVLRRVLQVLADTLVHVPGQEEDTFTPIRMLIIDLSRVKVDEALYEEVEQRFEGFLSMFNEHHAMLESALKMLRFKRQLQRSLRAPPAPDA